MTPPATLTPWAWIHLLYAGMMPQPGYAEFRLLGARGRVEDRLWMEWPTPEETAPTLPKRWLKGAAYFGVALRTQGAREAQKGDKAHTQVTHLVWSEVDLKGTIYTHGQTDVENMTPDDLRAAARQAFDDAMAVCEERKLPPRAVIYSGQGLHFYWARHARSTVEDTEAYCRGLCNLLEGDPTASEQARILRVPGTWHRKNPERPLPVEIWHADPDAWVEDADLEPLAVRQTLTKGSGDGTFVNNGQAQDADLDAIGELWKTLKTQPHPSGKGRHFLALDTAGWLRQNGYSEGDADAIVRKLAEAAGDEELPDRLKAVRTTYRAEGPTKGWTGLTQEFGLKLAGIALKEAPKPKIRGAGVKDRPKDGGPTLAEFRDLFLDWAAEEGHHYAHYEPWDTWFEYRHGVYVGLPEKGMLRLVDTVLQERGFANLSGRKLKDILQKVGHHESVHRARVDQGPWELNVRNGVLDLRTLELRGHSHEYFSIVQSPVAWDAGASCPQWGAFLTGAVPDPAMRALLRQYAGYALTGDMSAQKALFLIGEGGTGKGTFVHVLDALLGGDAPHSLVGSAPLEAIKDGSPQVEVLVGKRLCVISEISRTVNWEAFKRITGQDAIQVNPKFRDAYNVRLETKLVILSNVIPRLGDDSANTSLTRRFLPVAFDQKSETPDPDLREKLTAPDELAGILVWAVRGLAELREVGMRFPSSGDEALQRRIAEESNRIITFLEERAVAHPTGQISSGDLYKAYRDWCDEGRYLPVSPHRFAGDAEAALRVLGWTARRHKTMGVMTWQGLALKGGH